jgi:uncharacterized membrane protein HdeD (DUF308 family)
VVAAWTLQLARGILALALGLTITLTLEHTPAFGLLTFGVFAVLTGGVLLLAVGRSAYPGRMRGAFFGQAIVTLAAGIIALAVPGGDVVFFAILVGSWAVVAGLLEASSGFLARSFAPLARDWIIAGVLTVLLGGVALLLPPDFVQTFSGERGNAGTLTSSIILIGVVGAWAILVGVLQCISAVTVRADRSDSAATVRAAGAGADQ